MSGRSAMRDRGGFTLVELLTAMLIVATLVRIAIPQVNAAVTRARAAQIIGDFEVIQMAAAEYMADLHQWPPDASAGQIPTGLEDYLPENFSFQREHYDLDWENWMLEGGLPKHPETGVLIGVSVSTDDEFLGQAVVAVLGQQNASFSLGNNYTFLIE